MAGSHVSRAVELIPQGICLAVVSAITYFAYRWYVVRMKFRKLKAMGLPVMSHSMIWGHLGLLSKLPPKDVPVDAYQNYIPPRLVQNWKILFPEEKSCPHVMYLDLWPMITPIVIVTDPGVAAQYMHHPGAPKFAGALRFIYPLTKNLDLVSMEGQIWKMWRARFNPGFSARNLMGLLPQVLEEVQCFVDTIRSKAGKDGTWGSVFQMEECTTNLTFDVIGRAVLGVKLGTQRGQGNGLKEALIDIIRLLMFPVNIYNIWKLISPIRMYRLWRNHRIINRLLLPQIDKELRRTKDAGYDSQKTVLELAVNSVKEELEAGSGTEKLDRLFVETVLSQLKIFLFAGHDTTATSLCWIFHELQENPEVLTKMREEHDRVFGKDPRAAVKILTENPNLVNAIPYTAGVVKETLRLHPNVATAREGNTNFNLTGVPGYENLVFPTEGMMIWDGVTAMHVREDLWERATEFLPERWSAEEGDPLHPPKNTFRTFSIGPRNCIGKELAMLEMKLALVLLAREVDIEEAWEEWDRQVGRSGILPRTYAGKRLYQVRGSTPHPKDAMPVHLRLRWS